MSDQNEIQHILQEIEDTPYSEVTKKQLYIWGSKLLRASIVLGEQALEAEQNYNKTIVGHIDIEQYSVSESTMRAKASISYELKGKYDLYFSTTKEAIRFLENFAKTSDE